MASHPYYTSDICGQPPNVNLGKSPESHSTVVAYFFYQFIMHLNATLLAQVTWRLDLKKNFVLFFMISVDGKKSVKLLSIKLLRLLQMVSVGGKLFTWKSTFERFIGVVWLRGNHVGIDQISFCADLLLTAKCGWFLPAQK